MKNNNRRQFVADLSKIIGAGFLASVPFSGQANSVFGRKTWTVGEIMDLFLKEVKGAPFDTTVDTLKSGSRDNEVTGIVTTMFATVPVIRKAMNANANFIIAHEPTFYNHLDSTDWLKDDKVFQYKAALLKDNNITVWRNHDYIHTHEPDGVMHGVMEQLGWEKYMSTTARLINLPATTLDKVISHCKKKMGISTLRYIGDASDKCSKVLLMPGASGGNSHIRNIGTHNPDLIIVGELQEWETAEYVRDARAAGNKLSLIVLGHADSEEAGSKYMADWLKKNVSGIKVLEIPSGNPFKFS